MNWNEYGRKRAWLDLRRHSGISFKRLKKTTETFNRVVRVKIWIEPLQNTKKDCQPNTVSALMMEAEGPQISTRVLGAATQKTAMLKMPSFSMYGTRDVETREPVLCGMPLRGD